MPKKWLLLALAGVVYGACFVAGLVVVAVQRNIVVDVRSANSLFGTIIARAAPRLALSWCLGSLTS